MKLMTRLALKWRMLAGFLVCALLTGLSGGAGYWSLRQIQHSMKDTTHELGATLDRQTAQTQALIRMRGLATSITKARQDSVLAEIQTALDQIKKDLIANAQYASIVNSVESLLAHKQAALLVSGRITALRAENLAAIKDVIKLALQNADDAGFEAVLKIDEVINAEEVNSDAIATTVDAALTTIKAALSIRAYSLELDAKVKEALLAADYAAVDYALKETTTMFDNLASELDNLAAGETTAMLRQQATHLKTLIAKTLAAKKKMVLTEAELARTSDIISQQMTDLESAAVVAAKAIKSDTQQTMDRNTGLVAKWQSFLIALSLAALLLAVTIGFMAAAIIARPILLAVSGLNKGADQVGDAADQVSQASHRLAQEASEQAASIQSVSAAIDEMSAMVKQNADNANHADGLMKEANQVIGQATHLMEELTTSMEQISNASEKTSKIIRTIDEIAFQTNLLALNAAVEAARAGEAGAGFAVVADEVRSLAMRAAAAAQDTTALIETTTGRIRAGANFVQRTEEAFNLVSNSARKVSEIVVEISSASSEQSNGINQVNHSIRQMDGVTQKTAAHAEQSASASVQTSTQADQMKKFVVDLTALVHGDKNSTLSGGYLKIATPLETGKDEPLPAPLQPDPRLVASSQTLPMTDDEFRDF